jgi:hypothetical protein
MVNAVIGGWYWWLVHQCPGPPNRSLVDKSSVPPDEAMLRQKLEYIHQNPVNRGYVSEPAYWRYPSARNYAKIEALVSVTTDW